MLFYTGLPRRERQQGDVARALDRRGKLPLVRGAHAGQPAGNDLAAFGHELLQQAHVFVVDVVNLFDTEFADLLATEEFAPAFTAAGTTVGTIRPVRPPRR